MTDPLDLDALAEVARKATGGRWVARNDRMGIERPEIRAYFDNQFNGNTRIASVYADEKSNSAYIATFSPPTVLALLAALKEAQAGLADAWDEGAEFMNSDHFWHDNARDSNPYRSKGADDE